MTEFYSGDPGDEHQERVMRHCVPGGDAGMRNAVLRNQQPYEWEQLEEIAEAAQMLIKVWKEGRHSLAAFERLDEALKRRTAFRDA